MLDVVGNPQVQSVSQSNSASNSPLGDKQDKVSSFRLTRCFYHSIIHKKTCKESYWKFDRNVDLFKFSFVDRYVFWILLA